MLEQVTIPFRRTQHNSEQIAHLFLPQYWLYVHFNCSFDPNPGEMIRTRQVSRDMSQLLLMHWNSIECQGTDTRCD